MFINNLFQKKMTAHLLSTPSLIISIQTTHSEHSHVPIRLYNTLPLPNNILWPHPPLPKPLPPNPLLHLYRRRWQIIHKRNPRIKQYKNYHNDPPQHPPRSQRRKRTEKDDNGMGITFGNAAIGFGEDQEGEGESEDGVALDDGEDVKDAGAGLEATAGGEGENYSEPGHEK